MTVSMDLEFTLGRMVESMKVNTETIRNMVSEFTFGLMDVCMLEIGTKVSSMVSASTRFLLLALSVVFGKKVKELNGLIVINKDRSK